MAKRTIENLLGFTAATTPVRALSAKVGEKGGGKGHGEFPWPPPKKEASK